MNSLVGWWYDIQGTLSSAVLRFRYFIDENTNQNTRFVHLFRKMAMIEEYRAEDISDSDSDDDVLGMLTEAEKEILVSTFPLFSSSFLDVNHFHYQKSLY